jgi:type 1 fimbria pilin
MRVIIAALALLFLAVGPTFAAGSQTLHFRGDAFVPQSGYLGGADTSRESQIRAF